MFLVTIKSASLKVGVNWSLEKKRWGPRGFKFFFHIDLAFLDVRLVIDVSINIFLVFLFYVFFFVLFLILLWG